MDARYCECPSGEVKVAIADTLEFEVEDPFKRRVSIFITLDLIAQVVMVILLNDIISMFYSIFLIYFKSEVEHESLDGLKLCLTLEYIFTVLHTLGAGYITYYMIHEHDFVYQLMPFIYIPLFTKFGILYCGSELKFLKYEAVTQDV
jgi:hypothetical protein